MAAAAGRPRAKQEATEAAPKSNAQRRRERRDPRRRSVDAETPLAHLKNKDPNFKYVLASEGGHDVNSVNYYKSLGYQTCPTPTADRADKELNFVTGAESDPGRPLMQMGLVVMRISQEEALDIDDFGRYGSGGQAHADDIELQLANQAEALRYADHVNNAGKTYFEFQNLGRGVMPLKQDEALGDVSLNG